jgi:formylglycine-generating enzyme required for sulfatase activity
MRPIRVAVMLFLAFASLPAGASPCEHKCNSQCGGAANKSACVGACRRACGVTGGPPKGLSASEEAAYWAYRKSRVVRSEPPPPRPKTRRKLEFASIEPGTFTMGSPTTEQGRGDSEGQVEVTLTRAFLLQKTEVTQGEFYFVVGHLPPSYDKSCGLECPATMVEFQEVALYLNALSKLDKLEPCYVVKQDAVEWPLGLDCKGYRLPTEAEWEYAARAGDGTNLEATRDAQVWFYDNSDGKPHPVGKKKPNAWGLYDMLGNVTEWVWDKFDYALPGGTDPIGGGTTVSLKVEPPYVNRVQKGGAYSENVLSARPAFRFPNLVNSSSSSVGFRVARTK